MVMDIVYPHSRRTCCVTKAYGKFVEVRPGCLVAPGAWVLGMTRGRQSQRRVAWLESDEARCHALLPRSHHVTVFASLYHVVVREPDLCSPAFRKKLAALVPDVVWDFLFVGGPCLTHCIPASSPHPPLPQRMHHTHPPRRKWRRRNQSRALACWAGGCAFSRPVRCSVSTPSRRRLPFPTT